MIDFGILLGIFLGGVLAVPSFNLGRYLARKYILKENVESFGDDMFKFRNLETLNTKKSKRNY